MTTDRQEARRLHRRFTFRGIVLPFAGGMLLVVALVVFAALQGRVPTSAVANTMLTLLMLCPLALCLLPIYLLFAVAAFGMNRVHDGVAKPLRRLEDLTVKLRDRTYSATDRAARASINLNARFAPLDKLLFSFFDDPAQPEDKHD